MSTGLSNAVERESRELDSHMDVQNSSGGGWDENQAPELFSGVLVYVQNFIWSRINVLLYKLQKCQCLLF